MLAFFGTLNWPAALTSFQNCQRGKFRDLGAILSCMSRLSWLQSASSVFPQPTAFAIHPKYTNQPQCKTQWLYPNYSSSQSSHSTLGSRNQAHIVCPNLSFVSTPNTVGYPVVIPYMGSRPSWSGKRDSGYRMLRLGRYLSTRLRQILQLGRWLQILQEEGLWRGGRSMIGQCQRDQLLRQCRICVRPELKVWRPSSRHKNIRRFNKSTKGI